MGIPGMPPMPYMVGAPPPIIGGVMPMSHVSIHCFYICELQLAPDVLDSSIANIERKQIYPATY